MATEYIRISSDNSNMLQCLARAANYSLYNKQLLLKLQPALCSAIKVNPYSSQKLPSLPVPALNDTLDKFLRSVIPLLSEDELKKTTQLAKEFGKPGGVGEKLQNLLVERSKKTVNWLEEWWLNNAYLGYRLPVTVHSSPGLVFPLQKFANEDERLEYAARLIITAMKYKHVIDNNEIPTEMMGKDPLDMGQYKKFFGTCRVPKPNVDGLNFNSTSNHIMILYNNNFFKLKAVDEKNSVLSLKQVIYELKKVLKMGATPAEAVGILSSDDRDTWAKTYKLLRTDPVNSHIVDSIEKSLFLVCLDNPMPTNDALNRVTLAGAQTIHGGGSKANGGNRWFDKTVQFVIGNDGITGLTYEHSPSEGQPIAVMTDFLVTNMKNVTLQGSGTTSQNIQKLTFKVDEKIHNAIKKSGDTLDKLVADFDLSCSIFKGYGKNFIKAQKLSPDSYIQMAMQLSYYRLHKKPAAHYESAATRKYIGGRTETIRSCSVESVKFARAMLDANIKPMDKRDLLAAAVNAHKKYTVDAVNGFGVDRHLMGLKLIAKENNIPLPDFYSDKAYTKSQHFCLTSSQVATKCPGFMCYGAVVEDGYGICYNPRDNDIYYGIGCFNRNASTNAKQMITVFEQSLTDMHKVLSKSQKAKL